MEEGFRFLPTDYELLKFLLKFISKVDLVDGGFITTNVDTYGKEEPREIYYHGVPCGGGEGDGDPTHSRFFITKLKRKSETGNRVSRDVGKGTWKQESKGQPVVNNVGKIVGEKMSMSYVIINKKPTKKKEKPEGDQWLMKEYKLDNKILAKYPKDCSDYVLCALYKKHNTTSTAAATNSETTSIITTTDTMKTHNNNNNVCSDGALLAIEPPRDDDHQEVTNTTTCWSEDEEKYLKYLEASIQLDDPIMEDMILNGVGSLAAMEQSDTEWDYPTTEQGTLHLPLPQHGFLQMLEDSIC